MSLTPPFDPPYFSIEKTENGLRVVHTGADGSLREQMLGFSETAGLLVNMPDAHASAPSSRSPQKPAKASGSKRPQGATLLKVPFAEKDAAKKLGARWDAEGKIWYVPPGVDAAPFSRWLPATQR